uniref:Small ribosomal subunit protein eS10 n=1 Tax=Papio anubis TaxID=9555 RepID=A0A8I5NV21_PAPAN
MGDTTFLMPMCSNKRATLQDPDPTVAEMLMPKKNRIAIHELLFKEGVMVAKKDVHMPKQPKLADKNVPSVHVMKAMQSLKSRGYKKEQFAWKHFYWYLTNEDIHYLRDYLHLSPETVPATLCCSRPETGRPQPKGLEGERPARLTRGEADRDTIGELLCLLMPTRKPRLGLGQQPNSILEADLVVDMVSHLSKIGEDYFALNKLTVKKKKSQTE